jgi:hypothetical protein
MTRRIDQDTAEKLSIVLLTRAAFGTTAALRTSHSYGLQAQLVKEVLRRPYSQTRINLLTATRSDRRKTDR